MGATRPTKLQQIHDQLLHEEVNVLLRRRYELEEATHQLQRTMAAVKRQANSIADFLHEITPDDVRTIHIPRTFESDPDPWNIEVKVDTNPAGTRFLTIQYGADKWEYEIAHPYRSVVEGVKSG